MIREIESFDPEAVVGLYAKTKAEATQHILASNSNFSHQKADTELGYTTRSLRETLQDTIVFLQQTNSLKRPK